MNEHRMASRKKKDQGKDRECEDPAKANDVKSPELGGG